jgi:hypothetical protein
MDTTQPIITHLLEGGVQHEVRIIIAQRSGPKGVDLAVELFADPTDLILADPIQPERLRQGL